MSNGTTNLIGSSKPCQINGPLIVTIVGLPCHGKSLAAHKISRYLFWRGEDVKVFKVEDFVTEETLQNISEWFTTGHNVAVRKFNFDFTLKEKTIFSPFPFLFFLLLFKIIDGMNLSKQSRNLVANYCRTSVYHHLIVEFNCTEACVEDNIKDTALFYEKLDNNKDWLKKLQERFKKFTPLYEKCSIHEGPLITVNNSENQLLHSVTAHGVQGLLQTFILGVLSSPVIKHRIWTSELRRTISTVQNIPGPRATLKDLNEINAGICEGLTYEEIQERFPSEFAWRDQDKLKYRYPHGESYLDLLQRVDGVIQALLLNTDVLVVSHQAVLRCIISYFKGTKPEEIPYINVPLHTLIIVKSYGYDFEIETVPLKDDDFVDRTMFF
ncbi:CLUMA_CG013360, isoform B [Clunio marinus]|uniref:CLUMA_CG013360, isoform B n=1 Tax=Clunio marinus TaxID=568069 RepID=A0A1J1ILY3_9DIPT|nr:CLUMA_CG013360, isoform B [Clunio marinus]